MAKRKPKAGSTNGLSVSRAADGKSWVFVHPRCVRDRAEDFEEVRAMIDAGETEIATDELRWLLGGCRDFLAAHAMLGELALAAGDVTLARGHFGYAYEVGMAALRRAKMPRPLSHSQPANRPFFDAARGLITSIEKRGKRQSLIDDIRRTLRELDPSYLAAGDSPGAK